MEKGTLLLPYISTNTDSVLCVIYSACVGVLVVLRSVVGSDVMRFSDITDFAQGGCMYCI